MRPNVMIMFEKNSKTQLLKLTSVHYHSVAVSAISVYKKQKQCNVYDLNTL